MDASASQDPKLFLERLAEHCAARGEAQALVVEGEMLSWRELGRRTDLIAAALLESHCANGDRAAIIADAHISWIVAFLGALKAGMSIVPLSTMATPVLMQRFIEDSNARVLFADARQAARLPSGASEGRLRILLNGEHADWRPMQEWKPSAHWRRTELHGRDEFNLIYSSGTTGSPKGIVHDHALRAHQIESFEAFGLNAETRTLITTALYTNYSLVALLSTLGAGGCVQVFPQFREDEVLNALHKDAITHAFLVPTQISRLVTHPRFRLSVAGRSHVVISAGSPLSADLKRKVVDTWPGLLVEIYGATEGGASSVLVANQFPEKLGSVGKPSGGCDIRIIGEDGEERKMAGLAGEIVGRSTMMMKGYLNQSQANDEAIWKSPDGGTFLRSGDVGYFDQDGFLYLSDRKKDMIISGGLNVYADDVEHVLQRHPAVRECAVVAAPSSRWGEAPVAFVVINGEPPAAEALISWANAQMARHQRLRGIIYRPSLPRNEMGKVLKRELRACLSGHDYS